MELLLLSQPLFSLWLLLLPVHRREEEEQSNWNDCPNNNWALSFLSLWDPPWRGLREEKYGYTEARGGRGEEENVYNSSGWVVPTSKSVSWEEKKILFQAIRGQSTPNHQRWHAIWKLGENMYALHACFCTSAHRVVCSFGTYQQNLCVGAQSDTY